MRKAIVKYNNLVAGTLCELESGEYQFQYDSLHIKNYPEAFITFNMPVSKQSYTSRKLFPFFDGLIPEGWLLTIASESWKIKENDRMGLLLACCKNAVGAVSIHPIKENEDA